MTGAEWLVGGVLALSLALVVALPLRFRRLRLVLSLILLVAGLLTMLAGAGILSLRLPADEHSLWLVGRTMDAVALAIFGVWAVGKFITDFRQASAERRLRERSEHSLEG